MLCAALRKHQRENFRRAQCALSRTRGDDRLASGRCGRNHHRTNMAGRGTDIQLGGNPDMRIKNELKDVSEDERAARADAIRKEVAKLKENALKAGGSM